MEAPAVMEARAAMGFLGCTDTVEMIMERAARESWTPADMVAAHLQTSLLSYRSPSDAATKYGLRYIDSAPEDYANNTPWNNWTPPSASRRLFEAAQAREIQGLFEQRFRVSLCLARENFEKSVIAFATVQINKDGKWALCLRRGGDILVDVPLDAICIQREPTSDKILTVSSKEPSESISMCFKDPSRCTTLFDRLSAAH